MTEYEQAQWFCVLNERPVGPMGWEALRDRARRGQIGSADLVWTADFGRDWRPAGSVAGLLPEPVAAPPLLPPMPPPLQSSFPAGARPAAEPRRSPGLLSFTMDRDGSGGRPGARRALRHSWRSMTATLLRPFDLTRWFSIGLCAWLSLIGSDGPGLQRFFNTEKLQSTLTAEGPWSVAAVAAALGDSMVAAPLLIRALLATMVMGLVMAVVFGWLRARGSFMFLHRLAHPGATVGEAWHIADGVAVPLFLWRLGLTAAGWLGLLFLGAGAALTFGVDVLRGGNWIAVWRAVTPSWAALWGGLLLAFLFVWWLVKSLTYHFIEPLMYRHRDGIGPAWRRLGEIWRDHTGAVIRFYLLLLPLYLAIGLALTAFVLFSCCLGLVLLMIPIVGVTSVLPLVWVSRAYGAAFIVPIETT